ncbi:MAG: SMC-Scp complex subunit ScpB [Bryobacteraceae bacterium]|nr:SMC-Scp complex subunit ScpB [Bryobacteraceae bacterium]MDW8378602.1 SMC-Scp complex subunit ScpB [Bryobacterales bacterium]
MTEGIQAERPGVEWGGEDPSKPSVSETENSFSELHPGPEATASADSVVDAAQLLGEQALSHGPAIDERVLQRAMVEAAVYVTEEPLTVEQLSQALELPRDRIKEILAELVETYSSPSHGITVREIAGGYKMGTKAEHHERIRAFVKKLKPPLKLSMAALETLAVIAYKQPITAPEIMEIRGVQGAGVLKTLLERKLIAPAGRKQVVGKPILYKTTKEFLVQFGLKDLSELPTLKEFEDLRRLAFSDEDGTAGSRSQPGHAPVEEQTGSSESPDGTPVALSHTPEASSQQGVQSSLEPGTEAAQFDENQA